MNQVLDYSKVCGACSTPLTSPPRDGADSMCAYLHTRREFEATLKRNKKRQRVVDAAPEATFEATEFDEATINEATTPDEATLDENEATITPTQVTGESKSQRYKRLNRERINQQQKDRRNPT